MGGYMFGVRMADGRTAGRERDRRAAIAQSHGCEWTEIYDPSSGQWKSWFSTQSSGTPFDQRVEGAVMKEVSDG